MHQGKKNVDMAADLSHLNFPPRKNLISPNVMHLNGCSLLQFLPKNGVNKRIEETNISL
jgi:hypothetical protein